VFVSCYLDRLLSIDEVREGSCGVWLGKPSVDGPASAGAGAPSHARRRRLSVRPPRLVPRPPLPSQNAYNFNAKFYFYLSWIDKDAPIKQAEATKEALAENGECARLCNGQRSFGTTNKCCKGVWTPTLILRNVMGARREGGGAGRAGADDTARGAPRASAPRAAPRAPTATTTLPITPPELPQGRTQPYTISVGADGKVAWRVEVQGTWYTFLNVSLEEWWVDGAASRGGEPGSARVGPPRFPHAPPTPQLHAFPLDRQRLTVLLAYTNFDTTAAYVELIPSASGKGIFTHASVDDDHDSISGWDVTDVFIEVREMGWLGGRARLRAGDGGCCIRLGLASPAEAHADSSHPHRRARRAPSSPSSSRTTLWSIPRRTTRCQSTRRSTRLSRSTPSGWPSR